MWKVRRCRWSKLQHIHLISITESKFISVSTKNSTDSNSGSDRNVNNVTPTSFIPWHFLIASHTRVNAMHSRATIMRRACIKMLLAHICLPTQTPKSQYYSSFWCPFPTKYVPVLLRTTKLAQSTSQYCFVLQSSHKVRPSTTSYYKAYTKYVPVLLRTTKLAQSTSQYNFVLQSSQRI